MACAFEVFDRRFEQLVIVTICVLVVKHIVLLPRSVQQDVNGNLEAMAEVQTDKHASMCLRVDFRREQPGADSDGTSVNLKRRLAHFLVHEVHVPAYLREACG